MSGFPRYAAYFVPRRDEPLYELGSMWFGRDLESGSPVPELCPSGLNPKTKTRPRLYGFHATLKPPFCLKVGKTETSLLTAVAALAETLPASDPVSLTLEKLDGFMALRPVNPPTSIGTIANRIVCDLDSFRAAPTEADLARYRARRLTPRQEDLLARWGYPYVMAEFNFHITLTEIQPEHAHQDAFDAIQPHVQAAVHSPTIIRDICILRQAKPESQFEWVERFALS